MLWVSSMAPRPLGPFLAPRSHKNDNLRAWTKPRLRMEHGESCASDEALGEGRPTRNYTKLDAA
jgi:hypothetical protein